MYVIKKEYLVTDLNIWRKNGKVWWVIEYVKNWKIYKIFVWSEEEVKQLFWVDFPSTESELKELRKELKNEYVWKRLKVAEVLGFDNIFETFDTVQ